MTTAPAALQVAPDMWPAHPELEAYRAEFPIFEQALYLNSCSLGPLSRRTRAGMETMMELWNGYGASAWYGPWFAALDDLRAACGRVVGAGPGEIALAPSISGAISVIASSLDYSKRNKVVISDLDFPTVGYQWAAKAKQGVETVFLPTEDRIRVPLDAFEAAVDERTALVATSHVNFTSGYIQDIKALAEIAHRKGALLLVDAYQATGQVPTDVKAADVDFLLSGGLKWLLGGPGIVFMYVRPELIPTLEPTIPGWFAMNNQFGFGIQALQFKDDAVRFEQGTPSVAAVYAMLGGISYIEEIGVPAIHERNQYLTEDLLARAVEAGFRPRIAAHPRDRTAIIMVEMPDPPAVVKALASQRIIIDSRPGAIRISPNFYNTVEDNARIIDAVQAAAAGAGG
jgi:selenocysteine lyase/cysteine desulfurase